MPKSMTGFGRSECIQYDRRIKVEIKAVNHRYSDVTIKLPRFLNHLEDRIRRRLALDIVRGKVDVWVYFESFAQKDTVVNVDKTLADAYVAVLSTLSLRYDLGALEANPVLTLLAKNPDIVTVDKLAATSETDQAEIWETLNQALEDALTGFNQMRETEGMAMAEDVEANRLAAKKIVDEIARLSPIAQAAQAAKTRERIKDLVVKMGQRPDDHRLVTEMAILADKSCISEEIARLGSHLSQLSAMLTSDEAIGRKLDFWVQELNREANTIGSKSGDIGITALVVELKSHIEKMREQAQNVE